MGQSCSFQQILQTAELFYFPAEPKNVFTQPHKRYSGPLLGNQRHWPYHSIYWPPPTPALQHPDLLCSYPLTVFSLLHHIRTYLGNGLSVKILYCGTSLKHRIMKGLNICIALAQTSGSSFYGGSMKGTDVFSLLTFLPNALRPPAYPPSLVYHCPVIW